MSNYHPNPRMRVEWVRGWPSWIAALSITHRGDEALRYIQECWNEQLPTSLGYNHVSQVPGCIAIAAILEWCLRISWKAKRVHNDRQTSSNNELGGAAKLTLRHRFKSDQCKFHRISASISGGISLRVSILQGCEGSLSRCRMSTKPKMSTIRWGRKSVEEGAGLPRSFDEQTSWHCISPQDPKASVYKYQFVLTYVLVLEYSNNSLVLDWSWYVDRVQKIAAFTRLILQVVIARGRPGAEWLQANILIKISAQSTTKSWR